MLALRTVLHIDAPAEVAAGTLAACRADAVLLDLAAPRTESRRRDDRAACIPLGRALSRAGRPALVRVSDTRSGRIDGDLDAAVDESVRAVVLAGVEIPQDARDADVAIRRREMTLGIVPGTVRLVLEIDSAAGLAVLPRLIAAVDRTTALTLHLGALLSDMHIAQAPPAVVDHAFAEFAFSAAATDLPWVLFAPRHPTADPDHADRAADDLPTRAHDFGAAGVVIARDTEAPGLTSLYTPDPRAVEAAREIAAQWARLRADHPTGDLSEPIATPLGPRIVDRRSQRRARFLIALSEAIAERDAAP